MIEPIAQFVILCNNADPDGNHKVVSMLFIANAVLK